MLTFFRDGLLGIKKRGAKSSHNTYFSFKSFIHFGVINDLLKMQNKITKNNKA